MIGLLWPIHGSGKCAFRSLPKINHEGVMNHVRVNCFCNNFFNKENIAIQVSHTSDPYKHWNFCKANLQVYGLITNQVSQELPSPDYAFKPFHAYGILWDFFKICSTLGPECKS